MSTEKGDSVSTDDDEEIVFKKLSAGGRGDNYVDSDESFEEEYEDSDSVREREERQIYEYDEDEDVSFDYDEGSSSMDDLEHLDFEEEDEIMQVIVDEDGKANVAIVDEFDEVNDDEDVIIPLEDQSLKTEAEIGSEIFESSPYQPKEEEEDPETPSLKTSLRNITQQFVNATLVLGQPLQYSKSHSQTSGEQSGIQKSREMSVSTPSLHVDRELKRITDTYVDVTKNLGRWNSESVISSASEEISRRTVTYNKSVDQESASGLSVSRSSVITTKEVDSVITPQERRRSVGKVLGELGKSMISITQRIGRSFSTNSLTDSKRSSVAISVKQKSISEQSLVEKVEEDKKEQCESESLLSRKTDDQSLKSKRSSLIKSKSLSSIVDPNKTPELGRGLQKITEDVILITKCLQSPLYKRNIKSVSESLQSGKECKLNSNDQTQSGEEQLNESLKSKKSYVEINSIEKTPSDEENLNESLKSKESNKDYASKKEPESPAKRDIHPFIMKILKKEESVEISKILIEAHQNDIYREKLQEESMTLKNSIKSITNDILTVTRFLGTNPNEVIQETEDEHNNLLSDESIDFEDLKTEVPDIPETPVTPETPNMKLEIKKFTDDIVKVTKLLCNVRKEEILKVAPEEVYMRGGIDAMSCATMDSSPTK